MKKTCSRCKKEKTLSQFYRHANRKHGVACYCKECVKEQKKAHYRLNRRGTSYGTWQQMRIRCNCKTSKDYKNYGGRGIKVCIEWDSFEQFSSDMGPRPTPKHSIDRIDNDGNYTPENCRWATLTQQARNNRNCIMTKEKVMQLREDYAEGKYTFTELGEKYKCTRTNAFMIAKRKTWIEV